MIEIEPNIFRAAVELVIRNQKASASMLENMMKIGFYKSHAIIQEMERQQIVTAPNFEGKRKVLFLSRDLIK